MKSLLLRLVDRLSSPLMVLGALASAICLVMAVGVVIGGMTLKPPPVEDAPRHDGTVVLAPESAFEATPEPLPSVYLPPLVLPTRTPESTTVEPATDQAAEAQIAYGAGPDADAAALAGEPASGAESNKPKRFGEWLRSIFGGGSSTSVKPEASPTLPPVEQPTVAKVPPAPAPAPPAPASPAPSAPLPPPPPPAPAPQPRGDIAALLATLPIQGEDTRAKYNRQEFGKSWTKDARGCHTRHQILERDLTNIQLAHKCKVASGVLNDPYTGQTINFVAGPDTSDDVQIDHVVALRDAWGTGAQNLDKERRINFANDPLNLIAVDGKANTAKGHKNAAAWLPPNQAFHCHYVARQIAVKARYRLWVSQPEHDALTRALVACPAGMQVHGDTIEGA